MRVFTSRSLRSAHSKRFVALLSALFATSSVLVMFATPLNAATGSPTVTSDKADYAPGTQVVLNGAGWASGESVHIRVDDNVGATWSLDSGLNGAAPDPVASTNGAG